MSRGINRDNTYTLAVGSKFTHPKKEGSMMWDRLSKEICYSDGKKWKSITNNFKSVDSARKYTVGSKDSGASYTSIQKAIDDIQKDPLFHDIYIQRGVYKENLKITDDVTIRGYGLNSEIHGFIQCEISGDKLFEMSNVTIVGGVSVHCQRGKLFTNFESMQVKHSDRKGFTFSGDGEIVSVCKYVKCLSLNAEFPSFSVENTDLVIDTCSIRREKTSKEFVCIDVYEKSKLTCKYSTIDGQIVFKGHVLGDISFCEITTIGTSSSLEGSECIDLSLCKPGSLITVYNSKLFIANGNGKYTVTHPIPEGVLFAAVGILSGLGAIYRSDFQTIPLLTTDGVCLKSNPSKGREFLAGDGIYKSPFAASQTIKYKKGKYTLKSSDVGALIVMDKKESDEFTLTIPDNLGEGFHCKIYPSEDECHVITDLSLLSKEKIITDAVTVNIIKDGRVIIC